MQIAITPAHHDTTAKALIYALMPAARPSSPANLVLPKYAFADIVYRQHYPRLRERHPPVSLLPELLEPWHPAHFLAVPSTTFHPGNAPVSQCGAIPGRSQCTLSSRKYSSLSLRHSSCQFPVRDARRHGTNLTALAEMSCTGYGSLLVIAPDAQPRVRLLAAQCPRCAAHGLPA